MEKFKMKFLNDNPCTFDYPNSYLGYYYNKEVDSDTEFYAELEIYKTEYLGNSATVIFKPLGQLESRKEYRVLMNELVDIIKHCNSGVIKGNFTWVKRYGKFGIKLCPGK